MSLITEIPSAGLFDVITTNHAKRNMIRLDSNEASDGKTAEQPRDTLQKYVEATAVQPRGSLNR